MFLHCFVPFLCIVFAFFVRFLHWFSGQMRFFSQFFAFFCIPRHPLATCFCGIGFALFLRCLCIFYVLLCHQN